MKAYDKQELTLTPRDAEILARGTQGIEFRILRKKADLTLQEASKGLATAGDPLSTAMLSLFERGLKELRPATLARLEKIYGVSLEKSKENAEVREDVLKSSLLSRLPWLNPSPEPKTKGARQREIQLLRRENAELRFRAEAAEFQLKKNMELLNAILKNNEELQRFVREHTQRQINKAFYGEQ
jgi:hypothetical protein